MNPNLVNIVGNLMGVFRFARAYNALNSSHFVTHMNQKSKRAEKGEKDIISHLVALAREDNLKLYFDDMSMGQGIVNKGIKFSPNEQAI
jgi:hypothetical protein